MSTDSELEDQIENHRSSGLVSNQKIDNSHLNDGGLAQLYTIDQILNKLVADRYFPVHKTGDKLLAINEAKADIIAWRDRTVSERTAAARIEEDQLMAQRYLNHSERYYDADGDDAQVVRCGQINHELNKRIASLRAQVEGGQPHGDSDGHSETA